MASVRRPQNLEDRREGQPGMGRSREPQLRGWEKGEMEAEGERWGETQRRRAGERRTDKDPVEDARGREGAGMRRGLWAPLPSGSCGLCPSLSPAP